MSGRGLGFSGGTVDKLESIPGLQTAVDTERFLEIVRTVGIAIIGQSGDIAPADKKLYALRDVTATIDSIPLIASSIMSKKLAAGSDAILLDVKTGSGAFMKTLDDSISLAKMLVSIGVSSGKRVMALVTNMDSPLGNAIGNALEVEEAVATLRGQGPEDLVYVCTELASYMLLLGGAEDNIDACRDLVSGAITSGRASEMLCRMAEAQGGDVSVLENGFARAPVVSEVKAAADGYITGMDAEAFGMAALSLGAGRLRKEDSIDNLAGIILARKTGDFAAAGDTIFLLHTSDAGRLRDAEETLSNAITMGNDPPVPLKTILAIVTDKEVVMC
jgi:pyrimidine-nucleoside phosphorylase